MHRTMLVGCLVALLALGQAPATLAATARSGAWQDATVIQVDVLALDAEGCPTEIEYALPDGPLAGPATRRIHLSPAQLDELEQSITIVDDIVADDGTRHLLFRRAVDGLGSAQSYRLTIPRSGPVVYDNLDTGAVAAFDLTIGSSPDQAQAIGVGLIIIGILATCAIAQALAMKACATSCVETCGDDGVAYGSFSGICGAGKCTCVCNESGDGRGEGDK